MRLRQLKVNDNTRADTFSVGYSFTFSVLSIPINIKQVIYILNRLFIMVELYGMLMEHNWLPKPTAYMLSKIDSLNVSIFVVKAII